MDAHWDWWGMALRCAALSTPCRQDPLVPGFSHAHGLETGW